MTSEYVIWGKAHGAEFETLLVSEHAGLKDQGQAERTAQKLAREYGCTAMRIQRLEPLGDGSELADMFRNAVNR